MKKILTLFAMLMLLAGVLIVSVGCKESQCAHEWDLPVVVDTPTCSKGGYSISTCLKCGSTTRTILPVSDHPWSDTWSFDGSYHWLESTCQHSAVKDKGVHEFDGKYCITCGAIKASQGLAYKSNIGEDTYTVIGSGNTLETDIVIAHYYNGKEIVAVGDEAFADSVGINSIHLQQYIKRVGDRAFAGSMGLTEVTLTPGVEYLGSCLFIDCDSLVRLVFLGTKEEFLAIEKAGDWDGGNTRFTVVCTDGNLTPTEHTYSDEWTVEGDYHWREDSCGHANLITDYGKHTFVGKYCSVCGTIKASVGLAYKSNIGEDTYTVISSGSTLETDIVVARFYNGKLIVAVGEGAFSGSKGINSIHLQQYIKTVGDYAFAGSVGLTEVTLTPGVEYLGSCIFEDCESLERLVFLGTKEEFLAIEKAGDWDGGNNRFTIICTDGELPAPEHTYSEEWSYDSEYHWRVDTCGHTNLIVDYGAHVFEGSSCTVCGIIKASQGLAYRGDLTTGTYVVVGLGTTLETDIVVARYYSGKEITAIDAEAFSGVRGLKTVLLQTYINSVGDRAFADSPDLVRVTLTKGLDYIGSEIFSGCTSLTEVVFQGSLAEWEAITKADGWDDGHTGYTIICFDGTITK